MCSGVDWGARGAKLSKAQPSVQGAPSLGQEDRKADHSNTSWLSRQKGCSGQAEVKEKRREGEGGLVMRVDG